MKIFKIIKIQLSTTGASYIKRQLWVKIYPSVLQLLLCVSLTSGVGRSIIGGGGGGGAIFIYSCSALLTSFEIDCF